METKMIYKTEEEVGLIRESAQLVSSTLAEIAKVLRPGMTTLAIDAFANQYIRDNGALPAFLNRGGFPHNICISVNDVVVHGFPDDKPLKDGDIVSVDVGVLKNGFHGDHAYTFVIGEAPEEHLRLVRTTKESLYLGIEKAISGNRTGDIGHAVQTHAERHGYGVVRELVGHGLGRGLHEKPDVPNYGNRGKGAILRENLVLAIEPMINLGTSRVYIAKNRWAIHTADGQPSAHFEHDVCVKKGKAMMLSTYSAIEAAEKANQNLNSSS